MIFKSKYFSRIFIFVIIISIIPIILISAFSYNKASSTIQSRVNENNMQMLLQTQLRIEQMMKVIDYNCIQLINSNTLISSMDKNLEPKNYKLISDLTNKMSHIQVSEINTTDIIFLNYQRKWIRSTAGNYYIDYVNTLEAYKKYLYDDGNYFWVLLDEDYKNKLTTEADPFWKKYSINLIRKVQTTYGISSGLLAVKININELINFSSTKKDINQNYIILDPNNRVVWHNNMEYIGKDFTLTDYVGNVNELGIQKGSFNIELNENSYDAVFIKSDYNGWLYYFITPANYIARDVKVIGLYTLGICVAIIVLIGIVSFHGSKKIYSPVKRLYELIGESPHRLPETNKIDEFKFFNKYFQELMSNQTELMTRLKSQLHQLREYFLLKLLMGEMKPEEIYSKVDFLNYYKNWIWMYIFVVEIDTLEGTSFTEKDREIILFAINNMVNELIPDNRRMYPLVVNLLQVTIIGTEHDSGAALTNYAYSLAEMLQKSIKNCLGVKVSIGISSPFNKFERISTAYRESMESLKHKIFLGQEIIILYEDIKNDTELIPKYPVQTESDLIYALQVGDIQKANYYLNQFFNEIFENSLNYLDYQLYIGKLLSELSFIIVKEGESIQTVYNKRKFLYEKLITIKTRDELENWYKYEIIEPITKLIKQKRLTQQEKISKEIIEIIRNEYDTDITLDICSERLNYNPKYLSSVFYNETGTSFSKYLMQYRLEMAKKWLIESNMKIFDIAEKLRYANSQNFIRCFKKSIGLTPGQYRDKYGTTLL